jgi:single-strand DNA-binding protein
MSESTETDMINVVVLRGAVKGEPVERALPSGGVVVQFDIATRLEGGSCSAPITITDPPPAVRDVIIDGTCVIVLGGIRRRFFRVGGQTQSRTEVVATRIVPARRRAAIRRLLAHAAEAIAA